MASKPVTNALGPVQALRIAWPATELPRTGDHLTCRNGRGGWQILSVRRLPAEPDFCFMQGRRYETVSPLLAPGRSVWPWSATATAAPVPTRSEAPKPASSRAKRAAPVPPPAPARPPRLIRDALILVGHNLVGVGLPWREYRPSDAERQAGA